MNPQQAPLPSEFTILTDPRFIISMNYAGNDNFMGRTLKGYETKRAILTHPAALALIAVQDELDTYKKGYRLRIFDAYRPVQAVQDILQWSNEEIDLALQKRFFPGLEKMDLFERGYLAALHSSHSRGSTVDLTISIPSDSLSSENAPQNYIDLDMGSEIDFFGEISATDFPFISFEAKQNRQFLKSLMHKHKFINYEKEWWHYTLENEPFTETYFNFLV